MLSTESLILGLIMAGLGWALKHFMGGNNPPVLRPGPLPPPIPPGPLLPQPALPDLLKFLLDEVARLRSQAALQGASRLIQPVVPGEAPVLAENHVIPVTFQVSSTLVPQGG